MIGAWFKSWAKSWGVSWGYSEEPQTTEQSQWWGPPSKIDKERLNKALLQTANIFIEHEGHHVSSCKLESYKPNSSTTINTHLSFVKLQSYAEISASNQEKSQQSLALSVYEKTKRQKQQEKAAILTMLLLR